MKVLIVGGYGTFGGRLAQLLANEERATLVIAGRSRAKATAFCESLQGKAVATACAFDRDGEVVAQLRAIAPDIVVDATGPFQFYGTRPYRLVEAALALNINYLDLADGTAFVQGIAQFDAAARQRGLFVLSGVSSFPVLTAAVVRRLADDMQRVEKITGGIAPSPHANVGLNVIRAIAGYAGAPVKVGRDGTIGYALIDSKRFTIAPPGRLPLRPTRFSLVDVPDLQVLLDEWPSVKSVWMGAGPVPAIWHRALSALAWAVRWGLLPSLSPFASLMHGTMRHLGFGEHRGGMFVSVEGMGSDGRPCERSWHLLAEGTDGPLIPSMAAQAIVLNCLSGKPPRAGARAAVRELELEDYDPLFRSRRISTGFRPSRSSSDRAPLYQRMLGDAWDLLPPALQRMHTVNGTLLAEGKANIARGQGVLARLIAWWVGFPSAGRDVPVTVAFQAEGDGETWRRSFAGCSFSSRQQEGRGCFEGLICERFGPFSLGLALIVEDARLWLVVRGWSLAGLPLPAALAPRGKVYESAKGGRFCFHVEISHPWIGLIVHYQGWLEPKASGSDSA